MTAIPMRVGVLAICTIGLVSVPGRAIADDDHVVQFITEYCQRCHGPKLQRADRRFDCLTSTIETDDELGLWQDILDQLNLGEMPPEEAKHPTDEERRRVIKQLTKRLAESHERMENVAKKPVLRRLNSREYRNTIRDLLHVDMTTYDPTIGFPKDDQYEGFDNVGDTLVTSSYLLEHYLRAADEIIEKVVKVGPQPESKLLHMAPPFDRTTNAHSGWVTDERRHTREYQSIFGGTKERFSYRPLDDIKEGVPHDGHYVMRVKASGLHRQHPYDDLELIGTDPEEPIRLALVSGSQKFGTLHLRQSIERTLHVFDLPDDVPEWMECKIWLDKGYQPRMTYQNGPYFFKTLPHPIHRKYPDLFPIKLVYSNWWEVCQAIKTPQIRIFDVELEGPFYDRWPPAGHRAIFGDEPIAPQRTREVLTRFASRAFRRPATEHEIASLVQMVEQRQQSGENYLPAIKAALKAVLCSPSFLYLEDGSTRLADVEHADQFAVASRLSYFLWSSMPDDQLLAQAAKGRLSDPDVLRQETERMLADPRAKALAGNFTDRWLRLYKLGEMPPDSSKFKHYYVGELEEAMARETHLYFRHVLDNNLSIRDFLDSDYSFVNRPLAKHYGLIEVWENANDIDEATTASSPSPFRKVTVDAKKRGGLLGHASVLTATANGIDTSPVIRGVWVLENILGTPPSPPPPDVEPLEPDVRGAKTIREQLVKHRSVATCAECHRKIDPLGFALENFDAIGGERKFYDEDRSQPVDTTGELPDGHHFEDVSGLRQALLTRTDQFAHCLTEKLLTYALGRPLTVHDRPVIDGILSDLADDDYQLRELVHHVVQSPLFTQSRPLEVAEKVID